MNVSEIKSQLEASLEAAKAAVAHSQAMVVAHNAALAAIADLEKLSDPAMPAAEHPSSPT
jgi:hypothetical protein